MKLPLHVHVPWRQLDGRLATLLERRLQPEIGLQAADLDGLTAAELTRVATTLAGADLAVTLHAPFLDLNPGARDPLVRAATRQRLEQTLAAAASLSARLVVVHPGYDRWHYDHDPQLWLTQAVPFFRDLLPAAERAGVRIALENIFEPRPDPLVQLVDTLAHPQLGHCFDIGHWNLFAAERRLAGWLQALAGKLFHLHLHDNHGRTDQHLPPGEGAIDFGPLNTFLAAGSDAPSMTLEAHSEDDLERALAALPARLPAVT